MRSLGTRIIPAYAGSTYRCQTDIGKSLGSSPHTRGALPARRGTRLSTGDHPRIRGEHQDWRRGANPRTGIIPAYAGSTCSPQSSE